MSEAKVMPEDYIDFLIVSSVHFTATEAAKVQPDYPDPPADDAFTRLLHRLEPDSAVLWTEAQTQVQLTDVVLVRAFPFLVLAGVVGVGIPGNLIFPCLEVSMVPLTLLDSLATLPDPRSPHGRIHPLPAILGMVALAMLLGRNSLAGIARFGRQHSTSLAHALGFRRGKTSTVSTRSRTVRRFDAEQLEAILARWIQGRIDPAAFAQISIDGKTLRGSRDGELPGHHLVAAYAPAVQAVLAQIRVDAKTNEHKAALELLGILPLTGKVVVGDAMFCQRDLAEAIVASGGDYLFAVKDNQPGLRADLQAAFGFEVAARSIAAATSP